MFLNLFNSIGTVASDAIASSAILCDSIANVDPSLIVDTLTSVAISFALKLVKVLLIWFIGRWVARRAVNIVKKLMEARNVNVSIRTFV